MNAHNRPVNIVGVVMMWMMSLGVVVVAAGLAIATPLKTAAADSPPPPVPADPVPADPDSEPQDESLKGIVQPGTVTPKSAQPRDSRPLYREPTAPWCGNDSYYYPDDYPDDGFVLDPGFRVYVRTLEKASSGWLGAGVLLPIHEATYGLWTTVSLELNFEGEIGLAGDKAIGLTTGLSWEFHLLDSDIFELTLFPRLSVGFGVVLPAWAASGVGRELLIASIEIGYRSYIGPVFGELAVGFQLGSPRYYTSFIFHAAFGLRF